MLTLSAVVEDEIVVLGAHCDDIAIGMGGTLMAVARQRPGLRVRALVLTGGGTEREAEERAALEAFCAGASVDLTVLRHPDGRTPAHWDAVKNDLRAFAQNCTASLVFGPQRRDAHQDHRLLAELIPTEFRDHLVLGYEILKWETDTPQPTIFVPMTDDVARAKVNLLHEHYLSQSGHDWFDEPAFLGLSRLRGVQCRSPHAEAFAVEKALLSFG
ncbi:PIG-L deacetylase family protein [Gordonia bronchialis]|uniref:PIG-L deacetylase family protein n=1 Tax=Gordonia bronchialis TaxID=2054 RepID=UPI0022712E59|nr:PIG-L family deacetylase [Gordonia bronchialis]